MKKRINQQLVYNPQPGATLDEVMQIFKIIMFQSYPAELKTSERLTEIFNNLPENAQRHFKLKDLLDK